MITENENIILEVSEFIVNLLRFKKRTLDTELTSDIDKSRKLEILEILEQDKINYENIMKQIHKLK